jgi:hypothetical protein
VLAINLSISLSSCPIHHVWITSTLHLSFTSFWITPNGMSGWTLNLSMSLLAIQVEFTIEFLNCLPHTFTLYRPYLKCIFIRHLSDKYSITTFWVVTYNYILLSLISFKGGVLPPFQIEHPNNLPECFYIWEFHLKFQNWIPKVNCMELRPSGRRYFTFFITSVTQIINPRGGWIGLMANFSFNKNYTELRI